MACTWTWCAHRNSWKRRWTRCRPGGCSRWGWWTGAMSGAPAWTTRCCWRGTRAPGSARTTCVWRRRVRCCTCRWTWTPRTAWIRNCAPGCPSPSRSSARSGCWPMPWMATPVPRPRWRTHACATPRAAPPRACTGRRWRSAWPPSTRRWAAASRTTRRAARPSRRPWHCRRTRPRPSAPSRRPARCARRGRSSSRASWRGRPMRRSWRRRPNSACASRSRSGSTSWSTASSSATTWSSISANSWTASRSPGWAGCRATAAVA